ncbi:hypothetical protein SG26_18960 (plasmid) [Haloarcula sp. CBA1115]|nr:hypothetical protein SG26_18960 [Haloarcula sp. CBA1115]
MGSLTNPDQTVASEEITFRMIFECLQHLNSAATWILERRKEKAKPCQLDRFRIQIYSVQIVLCC